MAKFSPSRDQWPARRVQFVKSLEIWAPSLSAMFLRTDVASLNKPIIYAALSLVGDLNNVRQGLENCWNHFLWSNVIIMSKCYIFNIFISHNFLHPSRKARYWLPTAPSCAMLNWTIWDKIERWGVPRVQATSTSLLNEFIGRNDVADVISHYVAVVLLMRPCN